jgi:glycerol-3-phosphate dehydrogenase
MTGGLRRARLPEVASRTYDLAVVGGGINGVAVARDAALRGLRVLVLEKDDFGSGTSAWSTRLAHGGLRYLEHREFRLVRESLRDRETLLQIAPHLVTPLPFVVPLYDHNHVPGWQLRIGMALYDALSVGKSVPRHRKLGKKALRVELGELETRGLRGAVRYYDGQVVYAERLVVETLLSAALAGADAMNHATVTEIARDGGRASGVRVRDDVTGEEATVRAALVVNAAGPWVDDLTGPHGVDRMIGGTKGTHLVIDPFPGAPRTAIYYEARSDNRAILVVPWNGRYLIGTTDDRYEGDLDAVVGTSEEVDYLLTETNALLPEAGLTRASVLYTYAGIRPLPYRPGGSTGSIPRSHLILEHPELPGVLSIVGGKLTPHLSLGTEVVDKAAELLGRRLPPSPARRRALPGAPARDWANEARALRAAMPWPPEVSERLVQVYGMRAGEVLERARQDEGLARLVGSGRSAVVAAEVALSTASEAPVHLADLLHRRLMVGLEPALGTDVEQEVAEVAAPLLGWDAARTEEEIAHHHAYIRRLQGGVSSDRPSSSTRA